MYASATSGDKPNNAEFSECSRANISSVLFAVLAQLPVDPQVRACRGLLYVVTVENALLTDGRQEELLLGANDGLLWQSCASIDCLID